MAAADCRKGYPRSDEEQTFGDGAGAVMVSRENLFATFEGTYAICNEMMDVWRNPEDTFVKTWEGRFILGEGYESYERGGYRAFEKIGLDPKDIAKAVFRRLYPFPWIWQTARVRHETQVQDPLLSNVGFAGLPSRC